MAVAVAVVMVTTFFVFAVIVMAVAKMGGVRVPADTHLLVTLGAPDERHEEVLDGRVLALEETLALALGAVAVVGPVELVPVVGGDDVHILLR